MTTNNTGNPVPAPPHLAPLQHPPRRIRPPFDIANDDTAAATTTARPPTRRARLRADRVTVLLDALHGVELSTRDRRIIDWLAIWEPDRRHDRQPVRTHPRHPPAAPSGGSQ